MVLGCVKSENICKNPGFLKVFSKCELSFSPPAPNFTPALLLRSCITRLIILSPESLSYWSLCSQNEQNDWLTVGVKWYWVEGKK